MHRLLSVRHSVLFTGTTGVGKVMNATLTHSLARSLTHPPTHSLIRSLIHTLTHSLIHSPTHPPTHSPTHSLFLSQSVTAKGLLNKLQDISNYVPVMINFSAQTSSIRTQEIIESKLEKKRKTVLGRLRTKRNEKCCVIFTIHSLRCSTREAYCYVC